MLAGETHSERMRLLLIGKSRWRTYRLHRLVTSQSSLPIFLINAVGLPSRPGPGG